MDVCRILLLSLLVLTGCGSTSSDPETLEKSQATCDGASIAHEKLIRWHSGRVSKIDLRKVSSEVFEKYIQNHQKEIADVENNYALYRVPVNQSSFSLLGWGGSINWGPLYILADDLWKKNITGSNVVVAIIDSGIDTQHPQLNQQLYSNPNETLNGLDDDGNGLIDDIHGYNFPEETGDLSDDSGHGTHVAGIIAADHSAGSIQGVAPGAKLLAYDFFSASGDGNVYDAIAAIDAARRAGAQVINASWGGPGCSRSLKVAIDTLAQYNVLFVTAAGNESMNIDRIPDYPAAYDSRSLIAVGAMTTDELTAGFSNYGQRVHIMAPGTDIESTYPLPKLVKVMDGTSMAAPFVTGAAALLFSAFPKASAQDIKSAIIDSARPGPYPILSRGALDVSAAYNLLQNRKKK